MMMMISFDGFKYQLKHFYSVDTDTSLFIYYENRTGSTQYRPKQ